MLSACEAGEVLALLEGGGRGAREAGDALVALYGAVREPWLVRALLHYHARTGSARALDVLARAPDPHARHLLDALGEQLRGEPPARRAALAALAPLVARRPAWLTRLPPHPPPALPRDLLRAARAEHEPLPLVHALLALAALLPAAPALAAPHWPELADALLRPAALQPPPPAPARHHLQLAQLALFHALYATHPCTLLETLRAELAGGGGGGARDAWERGLQPLVHSVRLHPALVTGSRAREADAARRLEEHDVVAETRRLALHTPAPAPAPADSPAPLPPAPASAPAFRALAALRPGSEGWFALADRCGSGPGPDSAPHTPLPADGRDAGDAAEPPEAAVEATPENTPAKETRAAFRFPSDSSAVRAIGRRKETSPPAPAEPHSRLARVVAERRAAPHSPVPFGGAPPPAGAVRPEPRAPTIANALPELDALNVEDREVLELTARGTRGTEPWDENEEEDTLSAVQRALQMDPRRRSGRSSTRGPPGGGGGGGGAARRAASCAPAGARRTEAGTQTLDTWPEPYEFLIADFYRSLPNDTHKENSVGGGGGGTPCERLDAYLSELYAGGGGGGGRAHPSELAEQLALAHAQLMYERWRREAHAERNRRLLGRCRQTRALELHNAALQDRLRALGRERDSLRARLAAASVSAAPAPAAAEREQQLEAALQAERAGRLRAEAALHEAEAWRAQHAGQLQRQRGAALEAARHVEALARAALAAERRAEHVRRLRRELLVLAERDARLNGTKAERTQAGAGAGAGAAEERALRAALARAEAEAGAAGARGEACGARAHELEAALAARDAVVAELKRAARHAAGEHAARTAALQDKYEALMRVLRAAEGRQLERLAGGAHVPPASEGGGLS